MMVTAQISVYPLLQERLSPAIQAVSDALRSAGLSPEVGSMSTMVTGEAGAIFAALREGFTRAAATGHVVMTATVSNACPVRN